MQPGSRVEITAGTIAAMTPEQFGALQKLCAEGSWDHVDAARVSGGGDYIGFQPLQMKAGVLEPSIFIGIELDGYTHS